MRTKLILVAAAFLLASCSENSWLSTFAPYKMEIRQGNLISPEMRERIRVGMSRQQVSTALGSPLISDVYHANRWDYIYRLEVKGKLVEEHRLALYFKGDFVERIDDGDAPAVKDPVAPTGAVQ